MEELHCETLNELSAALIAFGPDALFRGQTKHFRRPEDGTVSLPTSFQRNKCIPTLMLKWSHYARRVLSKHVVGWRDSEDLAIDQAILQHYGWRSFFLDATGDARVAAWFASHKYQSKQRVEIVEDCFEEPVALRMESAWFAESVEVGSIYVISRKKLRAAGINAVHLSEIATRQGSPRYVRQDAYMVGQLKGGYLSQEMVVARITAPASVLHSYAEEMTTDWLFPSPDSDPIFQELLAMPWEKIAPFTGQMDAFSRSLPLPEYQMNIRRIMPARIAFYRPFWILDLPPPPNSKEKVGPVTWVLCDSGVYHGSNVISSLFVNVTKLLQECGEVCVETDGLIYHGLGVKYGKGVGVLKMDNGVVQVFEFGVEHPGLRISNIGRFPGVHYKISEDGNWLRFSHPDDCGCGLEHDENLRVLGIIERMLGDGEIVAEEDGIYVQKGLVHETDVAALKTWMDSENLAAAETSR